VKRFKIETQTIGRPFFFISESQGSRLLLISADKNPIIEVEYLKGRHKQKCTEQINLAEFIDIKGWKARGNRLSTFTISGVRLIEKTEEEPSDEGYDNEENPEVENHHGENPRGKTQGLKTQRGRTQRGNILRRIISILTINPWMGKTGENN
jgi:topoisomerase-4 subunit A